MAARALHSKDTSVLTVTEIWAHVSNYHGRNLPLMFRQRNEAGRGILLLKKTKQSQITQLKEYEVATFFLFQYRKKVVV